MPFRHHSLFICSTRPVGLSNQLCIWLIQFVSVSPHHHVEPVTKKESPTYTCTGSMQQLTSPCHRSILVFSKWVRLAGTLAQVLLKIVIWASTHMILHVWCTVVWFTSQDMITLCLGMPQIPLNRVQMCPCQRASKAHSCRKTLLYERLSDKVNEKCPFRHLKYKTNSIIFFS